MTYPTTGNPEYKPAATDQEIAQLADESGCPPEPDPAHAGWDVSMGCRLNYGRDPGGMLVVDVQLGPDYDGSGVIRRTITPWQLLTHATHLIRLAQDEMGRTGHLAPACDMILNAITRNLNTVHGRIDATDRTARVEHNAARLLAVHQVLLAQAGTDVDQHAEQEA